MRILGLDRWRIGVSADGYRELFPLWLRDVERIEVRAGPLVPGPLDIGALPPASGEPHDPRLGDAWLAWWLSLVEDTMRIEPPEDTSDPYGLDGLWPALQERATRRVEEFQHWHTARYHAGDSPDGRTYRLFLGAQRGERHADHQGGRDGQSKQYAHGSSAVLSIHHTAH